MPGPQNKTDTARPSEQPLKSARKKKTLGQRNPGSHTQTKTMEGPVCSQETWLCFDLRAENSPVQTKQQRPQQPEKKGGEEGCRSLAWIPGTLGALSSPSFSSGLGLPKIKRGSESAGQKSGAHRQKKGESENKKTKCE